MNLKGRNRVIGVGMCLLVLLAIIPVSAGAVPGVINYQGYLTDAQGKAVNGNVAISFAIWTAPEGGTALWSEPHAAVTVTEGVFNVVLGSSVPITAGILGGDRYLGITVGADSEMAPRMKVTSAAYSIRAGYAESVATGSVTTSALSDTAVTEAKIASGAVSSTKLGSASVTSDKVASGAVTEAKIGSSAISTDKLASGSVTGAKVAAGTLTASHLQDGTVLTEILDDDGPGSDLNADLLDNYDSSAFSLSGHNHDAAYVNATGDSMSSGSVGAVLSVTNTGLGRGVYGSAAADSGVEGASTGSSGRGVYGTATGASGRGVEGYASGTSGVGVYGTGTTRGVEGYAPNYGVYGTATSLEGRGVYGTATGSSGRGVEGYAAGTATFGIYGTAAGSEGRGVYGYASNAESRTNYGGYFEAAGGGIGVYGKGHGLAGKFDGDVVIAAIDDDDPLLNFSTTLDVNRFRLGAGAMITNSEWIVYPEAGYYGIVGEAWLGSSDIQVVGVLGHAQGLGVTVGVKGTADGSVSGGLGTKYGGHFKAGGPSGRGVYGEATATSGVNYGVHGVSQSPDGYAGFFNGRGYFSGNVGIGTTPPAHKLHVAGTARFDLGGGQIQLSTPGSQPGFVGFATNGNRRDIAFRNEGLALAVSNSSSAPNWDRGLMIAETGNVGIGINNTSGHKLYVNGSAYKTDGNEHWSVSSDARLKDVEGVYEYGLEEVVKMQPVRFHYKEGNALELPSDGKRVGLVAQDVQKVIPEAVSGDSTGYLALNATPIHYAMLNAIKELNAKIEKLENRIKELEKN